METPFYYLWLKPIPTHRSHLVPVYCFGETNLFVQVPNTIGSKYNQFQVILMKLVGFTLPVFHGRGIFNYTMGLIPFRRPIDTVGKLLVYFFQRTASFATNDRDIIINDLYEIIKI